MAIGTGTALLIGAGVSAATSAYGAKKASDASGRAAAAQTQAIDRGADTIRQEWERSRTMYDPYMQVGGNANMLMGQLMSPGGRTPAGPAGLLPAPGGAPPQGMPPRQISGPVPRGGGAAGPTFDEVAGMPGATTMAGGSAGRMPVEPKYAGSGATTMAERLGAARPGFQRPAPMPMNEGPVPPPAMSPYAPYRGQMGSVTARRL